MKKLDYILLFKICVFLLILPAIFRIIIFNKNYTYYNNDSSGKGVVTNIIKKNNYIIITIAGKANYKAYINRKSNIKIGDRIKFFYVNKEVQKNTIPNTFNYKKYLKSKNINQVIMIKKYKKIGTSTYFKIKGIIYNKILKRKSKGYIMTFLCGDKSYIEADAKKSFTTNGINHLLCVSGFHVTFLFGHLLVILKRFFKKEIIALLLTIMLGVFYLVISGFMFALFRAVIMYFLGYFKENGVLKIRSIYFLLFTFLLTLTLWPNAIYDVSFYYTYVLTLFLILSGNKKLESTLMVTIYCFIISAPITIYLNYNLNLLSIMVGVLSSFFVCFFLYPCSFLAIVSHKADVLLYKVSRYFELINLRFEKINCFKIIIPKISIYIVIFIYFIYLLNIFFPGKLYIYIYFLIFVYITFNKYFDLNTYLYFIDVKQGDMAVYVGKRYKNIILIDTGGIVNDKYFKNTIQQFLYSIGVKRIDNIVISHGDFDHMGEAINLVNNFKVEKVIFNCGPYNNLEKDLIKVLDKKKIKYHSCIKALNIDKNKLYFLQTGVYDNENDNSSVIYTELNGYKFMFMGDASITTEKEIMNKYNLSNIDILKVGHHGSKTSSSKEFIDEINPKYSIISVGKNNKYGHPNKEVLNNLENSKIYRTDKDGSIMFKIKNNKLKIETCGP